MMKNFLPIFLLCCFIYLIKPAILFGPNAALDAPSKNLAHRAVDSSNSSLTLNITAMSASNGETVFECWALKTPLLSFASAANFGLGPASNATYTVIPPRTVVGLRRTPWVQYSIIISGMLHFTMPNSTLPKSQSEFWLRGGEGTASLLIGIDTADRSVAGHWAEFPSDSATTLVQIPTAGGEIPEHDVLYSGQCLNEDLLAL